MPKLTAMMIVRNEADRYLQRCLTALTELADEIIILDDASTDATPEICGSFHQVKLHQKKKPLFLHDEAALRHELWELVCATSPEWILAIDADELFEPQATVEMPYLLKQDCFSSISFRLYDCWGNENYFRTDGLWNPWLRGFTPYIVKYQPQLSSRWPSLKFHCGRLPLAYRRLPHLESNLRIKHLGWLNQKDIQNKYKRALEQDPDCIYFSRDHYESILYPPGKIFLKTLGGTNSQKLNIIQVGTKKTQIP